MRLAIISDVHSNLEALTAALEMIRAHGVDEIVSLGDTVGYGANPNECVDLVRKHCSVVLLGNHDLAAVDLSASEYFTPPARAAAIWTSNVLTKDHKEYLRSLPYQASRQEELFVHSSPYEPEEWHYIITALDARPMFRYFTELICFVGHSHVPGVYGESGSMGMVSRGERFLINVGSVGQPRDGNPDLSFGIFDTDRWEYRNVRGPYDAAAAGRKILDAGLPPMLADRLRRGV